MDDIKKLFKKILLYLGDMSIILYIKKKIEDYREEQKIIEAKNKELRKQEAEAFMNGGSDYYPSDDYNEYSNDIEYSDYDHYEDDYDRESRYDSDSNDIADFYDDYKHFDDSDKY